MQKEPKPIDFVITYVDGDDPVWRAKRDSHLENPADANTVRFRDWGTLRYWFRCVEKNAPWVRKVHFVTDGQVPDWMETACGKLSIVDHKDFIPAEFLPTFSANPIELNLFRIPDLSEQFVFFNDDMFITAPMRREDFFRDGLPCDYAQEQPIQVVTSQFAHILQNDIILMNELFERRIERKKTWSKLHSPASFRGMAINLLYDILNYRYYIGFKNLHTSSRFLRSACEELWERAGDTLRRTCMRRFRDAQDVNQYVFLFYQYIKGLYHPCGREKTCRMIPLTDGPDESITSAAGYIRERSYQELCLNDEAVHDYEESRRRILKAFEETYPDKSMFEK